MSIGQLGADTQARFVFRSVSGLATAIRGPPPPRVAHSTPLSPLYLGTHMFFRRAAGSVVAPGFLVLPRPSGASPKGVCTRLGGFPVPRRKTDGRVPSPSGLKKIPPGTSKPGAILLLQSSSRSSCHHAAHHKNRVPSTKCAQILASGGGHRTFAPYFC